MKTYRLNSDGIGQINCINTELFLDQSVASSLKDVEGEDGDAALEEASFFRTSLCKLGRLLKESLNHQLRIGTV